MRWGGGDVGDLGANPEGLLRDEGGGLTSIAGRDVSRKAVEGLLRWAGGERESV